MTRLIPIIVPTLGYMLFAAGCFNETVSADNSAPTPPKTTETAIKPVEQSAPPSTPLPAILPPAPPRIPRDIVPLAVDGFQPASHVGPKNPNLEGDPVVIVLHGNYDRPEWQCDIWHQVAGFYGWILCPRGIPTSWAEPAEDRWMFPGSTMVDREIKASLRDLKTAYPGRVRDDGTVLVGFSLGATLAPNIIIDNPGMYSWLYLVEGGAAKMDNARVAALKRAGIRGIGMAMSTSKKRRAAKWAIKRIHEHYLKSVYVDMSGAGHNYRSDFNVTGRQSLLELISTEASAGTNQK